MRQTTTMMLCSTMLALLLSGNVGNSAARVKEDGPWNGWHGPIADGIEGLRFGMDRFTVARVLEERGHRQRSGRAGTLRYEGELHGVRAEVIAEFVDDQGIRRGGHLSVIKLYWDLSGTPSRPYRIFEELDVLLQERYGDPLLRRDPGLNTLSTGNAVFQRIYQGPEMRAFLELRSPRTERFLLLLTLQSPQFTD